MGTPTEANPNDARTPPRLVRVLHSEVLGIVIGIVILTAGVALLAAEIGPKAVPFVLACLGTAAVTESLSALRTRKDRDDH